MATAAKPNVKIPKNLSDLNSTAPATGDALSPQLPQSSLEESKGKSAPAKTSDAVTSIEKKMKRAERFSVSVQLSEEEKRNSRAERFGTVASVNGSNSLLQSEELKRKARSERFGGAVQSTSADEEAKKKARVARFGSISQDDSVEEEKKKARAMRFSKHSGAVAKENGKGNIEVTTAIAGKVGART